MIVHAFLFEPGRQKLELIGKGSFVIVENVAQARIFHKSSTARPYSNGIIGERLGMPGSFCGFTELHCKTFSLNACVTLFKLKAGGSVDKHCITSDTRQTNNVCTIYHLNLSIDIVCWSNHFGRCQGG
jgi:hypothetical protein